MGFTIECLPAGTLSRRTIDTLAGLIAGVVPGSAAERVRRFVDTADTGHFCLLRDADTDRIRAYNYFHTAIARTPFHPEPLPVHFFGSAYKDPTLRGVDVIWILGSYYGRRTMGRRWFTRRFVGVMRTFNPRVMEQWHALFPEVYPRLRAPTPEAVHRFNVEYNREHFDFELIDPAYPYSMHPYTSPGHDFTSMWQAQYRSRHPDMNRFALEYGGVERRDGRVLMSDRLLHFVGYYDPAVAARRVVSHRLRHLPPVRALSHRIVRRRTAP